MVDGFVVADELDRGGFGVIYSAYSASGWRGVAKRVSTPKAYYEELSVLRQLPMSPSLCALVHANDIDYLLFFNHGGDNFFTLVEHGRQLPTCAWTQLFTALELLHDHDIAHRDLKLENLMWNGWTAMLIDFGLAKVGGSHLCHAKCGTRSYCPPEVLCGKPYNGTKADLWSMGICLFAYCCGFFPFREAAQTDWRWEKLSNGVSVNRVLDLYENPTVRLPSELVVWRHTIDGMLMRDANCRCIQACLVHAQG